MPTAHVSSTPLTNGKQGRRAGAIGLHSCTNILLGAPAPANLRTCCPRRTALLHLSTSTAQAARQLADSRPCIYWRPADLSHSVGFNPLENVLRDERWKVTADIVSVFADIWKLGPETPRLLYYLRASVRLLLDNPNTTLLDIRRVLADDKYRARLLRKCTDKETRQTWTELMPRTPGSKRRRLARCRTRSRHWPIPCHSDIFWASRRAP